jgi:hypothetical protein
MQSRMFTRMGDMEAKQGARAANVDWLYTHPTSTTRVKVPPLSLLLPLRLRVLTVAQALEALLPAARDIQAGADCGATAGAFDAFRDAFRPVRRGW